MTDYHIKGTYEPGSLEEVVGESQVSKEVTPFNDSKKKFSERKKFNFDFRSGSRGLAGLLAGVPLTKLYLDYTLSDQVIPKLPLIIGIVAIGLIAYGDINNYLKYNKTPLGSVGLGLGLTLTAGYYLLR